MEIQNSDRRNSEYALIESQRELEPQGQQLLEADQSKLNVREYICVASGDEGPLTSRRLCSQEEK